MFVVYRQVDTCDRVLYDYEKNRVKNGKIFKCFLDSRNGKDWGDPLRRAYRVLIPICSCGFLIASYLKDITQPHFKH